MYKGKKMKNVFLIILTIFIFSSALADKKSSFTNSIGMKFVYIPPGEAKPYEYGEAIKQNYEFYIQSTEVTQEQWEKVMNYNNSYFTNCRKCPVETVSWNDAQAFVRRLNYIEGGIATYRLPLKEEWQYVSNLSHKNETENGSLYSWNWRNSGNRTHPVGRKRSDFNIFDMKGNVSEITNSFIDYRHQVVLVGDSFTEVYGIDDSYPSAGRLNSIGFRVVKEIVTNDYKFNKNEIIKNKKAVKRKINLKETSDIIDRIFSDGFDTLYIKNIREMNNIESKETPDYHLEYGKMDYSYLRRNNPYIKDMYFLEVESKKKINLEKLQKKMKKLGFSGPELGMNPVLPKNYSLTWVFINGEFGCKIEFYEKTKNISIQWRDLSKEWFTEISFAKQDSNKKGLKYCFEIINHVRKKKSNK